MEPHGKSPWSLHFIPSYAKASEGYPRTAKSAEAAILRCVKYLAAFCAFIHGHSPRSSAQADKMNILLVPVGEIDKKVIERLQSGLGKIFNKQVEAGQGMSQPDYAYDKKRNQYLSTAILKVLMEQKEYMVFGKVLGVVDQDLYVPELNFVFGEAGQKAAVISLTRLRQEFYRLPQDQSLYYRRALTEAVHELGHTYGLGHCENPRCVMFFSNSLMDTDMKGPEFCSQCKTKLSKVR
jgi:archaemetzincin